MYCCNDEEGRHALGQHDAPDVLMLQNSAVNISLTYVCMQVVFCTLVTT